MKKYHKEIQLDKAMGKPGGHVALTFEISALTDDAINIFAKYASKKTQKELGLKTMPVILGLGAANAQGVRPDAEKGNDVIAYAHRTAGWHVQLIALL